MTTTKEAVNQLARALSMDKGYFDGWVANIAGCISDEFASNNVSLSTPRDKSPHILFNQSARRFLNHFIACEKNEAKGPGMFSANYRGKFYTATSVEDILNQIRNADKSYRTAPGVRSVSIGPEVVGNADDKLIDKIMSGKDDSVTPHLKLTRDGRLRLLEKKIRD